MTQPDETTVVCFDLGGVLVRICRSWGEACALAKLPIRSLGGFEPEEWHERRGVAVDAYQRGAMSCRDYFQALSETTDGAYTPDEVERIHRAWTREEYPGVQRLIAELNTLPGVTTACLSNTNHAHWQRLSGDDARGEYPAVRSLRHTVRPKI